MGNDTPATVVAGYESETPRLEQRHPDPTSRSDIPNGFKSALAEKGTRATIPIKESSRGGRGRRRRPRRYGGGRRGCGGGGAATAAAAEDSGKLADRLAIPKRYSSGDTTVTQTRLKMYMQKS
ncbi:hypothetical protein G7Z17_g5668 [Cylindrodendrum hubeiense]|uniref:Uncharacterized protein n=1 Tax=Cylindrodendrum hubeiense TaxID=595255 RepID=A0A9P5HCH9_9HYPO|nr:hypothetical protein G7Z17_g5668 [Cylindrodendrum hubeiense]